MTAPAGGAGPGDAGRVAAMVAGLNAIVWERDPETLAIRWVNDRIAEVLGHPVAAWLADPDLWRRSLHPADRDRTLAELRRAVAEARDYALDYRVLAADGRLVWLRHLGHVAVDEQGRPAALHAVLVDVTAEQRREQTARVSAGVGQALTSSGPLAQRLQAVVDLLVGEVCDQSAIWLRDDDGRHRAVAAAPPALAEQVLPLAPVVAPPELHEAYERGEPLVLGEVSGEMVRASTDDEHHFAAAAAAVSGGALLVMPLKTADGPVLGTLTSDLRTGGRRHDAEDLALAADLGRRIAETVRADRAARRQEQLHQLTVALSGAATVADAARALTKGLRDALSATVVTVCTIGEDGLLRPVDTVGYPAARLGRYAAMPTTAALPLTTAVREREPQWLIDRAAWEERFPEVAPALLPGTQAGAALPLLVGDRAVGAVGVSFGSPRVFDADTCGFLTTLAAQAAVAVDRAALADVHGEIAEVLQRNLLPRTLPQHERLAVAARYLPGVRGTRAGGDWYDVLPVGDGRTALVVGDVVGEGASAAAVMGRLRSALAALLLEGHEPERALDLLDRFARTVDGAQVSTVACLLLDPAGGELVHATAGHPPPLLLDDAGARFLDGAHGPALALPGPGLRTQARTTLLPGATLVLYTDGLVERRGAPLDDGLARLAERTGAARSGAVPGLLDAVLDGMLGDEGPGDDVAVVAARLVPEPLLFDGTADAGRLRTLRADVRRWAAQAVLDADTTDDLLLAVGEAAANAVEHAYGGLPGRVRVEAAVQDGARVQVTVADSGRWRPPPADPGSRGRGLLLVDRLARDLEVDAGPGGTVVRFAVPLPRGGGPTVHRGVDPAGRPARLTVSRRDDVRCVELTGDLDLAGVLAIRTDLLAALGGAGPVVLDLTGLDTLSSSGLGLLLEAVQRRGERAPHVLLPETGPVRRLLDMTGLAAALGR